MTPSRSSPSTSSPNTTVYIHGHNWPIYTLIQLGKFRSSTTAGGVDRVDVTLRARIYISTKIRDSYIRYAATTKDKRDLHALHAVADEIRG